ncbi:MAG: DUF2339 domain-containing protein [Burkholderiales bacterium]|nr:DUF2339 domain-containing protein [Burkholderiales bacterium]
MADVEAQLRALNLRLARLEEAVLGLAKQRPEAVAPPARPAAAVARAADEEDRFFRNTVPQVDVRAAGGQATRPASPFFEKSTDDSELTVTQIMGWTGATLLVLAAAYLIRLVYDAGWLTPPRQLGLAVLGGVGLIVAGLRLRRLDSHYASLLPAGGLVVFFLAIYGAHLYYHLIGAGLATTAVICNCLLALWLGRVFGSEIYGLFAVVGSYSAPLLLQALTGSVVDLAIYFTAWSVVFSVYAVAIANRRPYLLAGYMALLAFQLAWEHLARSQWGVAVVFQTLQFLVFLAAAITFSIRHDRPLTRADGIAHLPLLLLFYGLQYALLERHVPDVAPWVAVTSAAVLLVAYGIARRALGVSLEAGGFIVGSYGALVLFHAVYLELLPERWAPWAVLLVLPPAALFVTRPAADAQLMLPFKLLLGALLALNFTRVVLLGDSDGTGQAILLALLYTAELYAAWFIGRGHVALRQWMVFALYAAHIGLMGVVLRSFDNALLVSLPWGALALACLLLAFRNSDQDLGKSSLFIFAASLVKVMLYDLAGAAPLVRIGSLVVVGLSLYAGGLLYKRVVALER